jgi:hypothetical protein
LQGLPAVAKVLLRENKKPDAKKLTDDQLLDKVQETDFPVFLDFAEPHSGMARERYILTVIIRIVMRILLLLEVQDLG